MSAALWGGAGALFGLVLGSFANVLVHRLPRGESIVWPGSRCPECGHPIAWFDNVPLLSWLLLRGRCRHCRAPISRRYPLVELAFAVLWGGVLAALGPTLPALGGGVFLSLLLVLALIDLETMLLPDVLTLGGTAAGLALAWLEGRLPDAAIGAAAGYGVFAAIAWIYRRLTGREGLGGGDWKLLAMIGAFLGWRALPFVVFASALVGLVVGGAWLVLAGRGLRAEIPYGPFLAAAAAGWWLAEALGLAP